VIQRSFYHEDAKTQRVKRVPDIVQASQEE